MTTNKTLTDSINLSQFAEKQKSKHPSISTKKEPLEFVFQRSNLSEILINLKNVSTINCT
jgi:hypothetical protein